MKKFWTLFRQSLRAIFANKVRSFLTLLGIVIGVASVISMISLGEGVNRAIGAEIDKLGSTNLTILPAANFGPGGAPGGDSEHNNAGNFGPPGLSSLTLSDLERLRDRDQHPYYESLSGIISTPMIVKAEGKEYRFTVNGVSAEHFTIMDLGVSAGNLFNTEAIESKLKVAILGPETAEKIFGGQNALGKKLIIGQGEFEVIGIAEQQDETPFENPNVFIFIPLTTAADIFGASNLTVIIGEVKSEDLIEKAKTGTEKALLASHGITDAQLADFAVLSAEDLLKTVNQITGVLTGLLAGIAGISLVVGGIGIMNIMMVAVTERTREIGLRKAVGARTSDILIQFLIEALMLTVLGGLIGIALGFVFGQVVNRFIDFEPVVTGAAIALAVGVSGAVGILFGLYPAIKAAALSAIDALRYE